MVQLTMAGSDLTDLDVLVEQGRHGIRIFKPRENGIQIWRCLAVAGSVKHVTAGAKSLHAPRNVDVGGNRTFLVRASYLEIYNEECRGGRDQGQRSSCWVVLDWLRTRCSKLYAAVVAVVDLSIPCWSKSSQDQAFSITITAKFQKLCFCSGSSV